MKYELQRRTPGERLAYLEGYESGIRVAAEALQKIAAVSQEVAIDMQTQIGVLLVLGAQDSDKK